MLPDVRVRVAAFLILAAAASACGGEGGMRSTFNTLRETPPPGAATPAPPSGGPTEPACGGNPCREKPVRTGVFDHERIPEASGAAVSRRRGDLLWLVDDREGADALWAVETGGGIVATLTVTGMAAVNAEALASGPCAPGDDEPCLYVGDIGDNARGRRHVRVLRVREPDLGRGTPPAATPEVIELRYPDSAHDAEALLVDAAGVPYLVTKAPFDAASGRTGATHLFAAPGFRDGLLLDLGVVPLPEPDNPVVSLLYGNTVTGGDAAPGRVLLRTYDQIVEFVAPAAGADLAGFPSWPHGRVTAPWQPQAEAVTYAADGCGYYSISEGAGDIWFVPCTPAAGTGTDTDRETS